MKNRFIGATLLILGTCIGGSMLALPIATASEGIMRTMGLMFGAWLMMTIGAFVLLKVNLRLPENSNLISMAKATLGKSGAFVTWFTTLILLYTLLSAYISSGQDLFAAIADQLHFQLPMWLSAILFTIVFGFIVFRGIHIVDYVNRGLMSGKLLVCFLLIVFLIPFAQLKNLSFHHLGGNSAAMTSITAFGFASIIPSIRSYLRSESKKLHWAILLGGLIPLVCYIGWILAVQATIPTEQSLATFHTNAHPLQQMIGALTTHANNKGITIMANLFTSICILTSFLGVSLSLSDFLSDGTKIQKRGAGTLIIAALTLLPPLVVVLLFPSIFLTALNYAGILCIVLLFLMPILMAIGMKLREKKPENALLASRVNTIR